MVGKERFLVLGAALVMTFLVGQVCALIVFTADTANAGPQILVLRLSNDEKAQWAANDLVSRLKSAVNDDPFIENRLFVRYSADPREVLDFTGSIVIYVTHGGMNGLLAGDHVVSWPEMTQIVTESRSTLHLFAACYSKEILQYGEEDSGKWVYGVPGSRSAEITNVEIMTAVKLALGFDEEETMNLRSDELTDVREWLESGGRGHNLAFQQVVLDQTDTVEADYDQYYEAQVYERYWRGSDVVTWSATTQYSYLPADIRSIISQYFPLGTLTAMFVTYELDWYTRYEFNEEEDIWETDPVIQHVIIGGRYSGVLNYSANSLLLTAEVDSDTQLQKVTIEQDCIGGVLVEKCKDDGVWQEPLVSRRSDRNSGFWYDVCNDADYERDTTWPAIVDRIEGAGTLVSTDGYLTVTNMEPDQGWHGPSYVQTLDSCFQVTDLDTFSAALQMLHAGDGYREGELWVSLYDVNKKAALSLCIFDDWVGSLSTSRKAAFGAYYFKADGTYNELISDYYSDDMTGTPQIRYDPNRGLLATVPGESETVLYTPAQVEVGRLMKYIVIQSYLCDGNPHDERVDDITVSYFDSQYTVFHDPCNDINEFAKDSSFGWGIWSDGSLTVPSGTYMQPSITATTPAGWHGPCFVHKLDRPFRLYQLSESDGFQVVAELVQSVTSTMGQVQIALFDENKKAVVNVYWGDSWGSYKKGYYRTAYYDEDGTGYYHVPTPDYTSASFTVTAKLGYDEDTNKIYTTTTCGGSTYSSLLGPVDDSERVITYVAILIYRYSSYVLQTMKIHDIKVTAQIGQAPPSGPPAEPVSCDGTEAGTVTAEDETDFNTSTDTAESQLQVYWLFEPWPYLHMERSEVDNDDTYFHTKTPLAGDTTVLSLSVRQQDSQAEVDDWLIIAGKFVEWGVTWALQTKLAFAVASAYACVQSGQMWYLIPALAGTVALMAIPLIVGRAMIALGWWDVLDAAFVCIIMGLILLFMAWGQWCWNMLRYVQWNILATIHGSLLIPWGMAIHFACKLSYLAMLALTMAGLVLLLKGINSVNSNWF